jgi:hypothetical protein
MSTEVTRAWSSLPGEETVIDLDAGSEMRRLSMRPPARSIPGNEERGIYPCPFGYAVNVPLQRSDRLVPVVADDPSALGPLADALALVRASGGFEARRMRVPTAEIRFVYQHVPDRLRATRRLRQLARDLLALGHDALPGLDPALDFHPALELRCPDVQALSVHLYVEGTSSLHETLLACFAERLEPALRALIEANARVETPFVLRRRVLARCHVELDQLFASLPERAPDEARQTRAVQQALHWLGAARSEPVLAVAQNELVLNNVARVARALDDDGRRSTAEGHCHAARFGAAVPLASFAAAGPRLLGALELPLGVDARRRPSFDAALGSGLVRGESMEDIGVLSTCLGLAAQLASVKAAISLALSGVVPMRASVPPPAEAPLPRERPSSYPPVPQAASMRERRSTPPPLPVEAASTHERRSSPPVALAPALERSSSARAPAAAIPAHAAESSKPVPEDAHPAAAPRRWAFPLPQPASAKALRASAAPARASTPPPSPAPERLPPNPARRSRDDSGVRPALHARRVPPPARRLRGERR